ncbi:odorant-binding protein 4 isoform X1 [Bombyx mori]|uniref:Uncharacterized protein n=1 Tax=Bombyx mori TaxID=7091 RepID=A0A8R2GAC4_BOMMO|nr:odorant-binding protein 4 isoform X1 [Bombyx mori]
MLLQILFSFFIISGSYAKTDVEIKAWFLGQAVECSKDHPVTTEELRMHKHELPDSKNAKCLMKCVFRKCNWLDSKGMYDINAAYASSTKDFSDDKTKQENANKLFDTCKSVNEENVGDGEEGCDRSLLLAKCLTKAAPQFGFQL